MLHVPCHPSPPLICLPEPEELTGGVRPIADQPVHSGAQATSAAAGPPSPVPGWVGMAGVVLLRVRPSLHPLQTLLCAAFCAPEAVASGLLHVARDQRMLVAVGALRRMLLVTHRMLTSHVLPVQQASLPAVVTTTVLVCL
jgi:hypothetical protein